MKQMKMLFTKRFSFDATRLQAWGWKVDIVETLEIKQRDVREIGVTGDAWIISSRHAWPVVERLIAHAPPVIYCIGEWTAAWLKASGTSSHVRSFASMEILLAELKKDNHKTALYFCGDVQHVDLEGQLRSTIVHKVITHESIQLFPTINDRYDAIFVFSPRGVESLLKNNHIDPATVFVCIGPTTRDFVNQKGFHKTYSASKQDSVVMVEEFYRHLMTEKIQ